MKKKIILGIILLLILGGIIYWYEVRPAMIRNQCSWKAWNKMSNVWEKGLGGLPTVYSAYYELIYRNCIRNKGIKE